MGGDRSPFVTRPAPTLATGHLASHTHNPPREAFASVVRDQKSGNGHKIHHARDTIIIIDFGGQLANKIWRVMMDVGTFAVIVPHDIALSDLPIPVEDIKGVILSGGPSSVYDDGAPRIPAWVIDKSRNIPSISLPVLGICYGMQEIAHELGGTVKKAETPQYGTDTVTVSGSSALFKDVPQSFKALVSHGDEVVKAPQGFLPLAYSGGSLAAMFSPTLNYYAVQFHPESMDTVPGRQILTNFAVGVCGAKRTWSFHNFIVEKIKEIKDIVGESGRVLHALSGGVDSTTLAVLLSRALGERVTFVFINTGLLRKNEDPDAMELFAKLGLKVIKRDAGSQFLAALKGVKDPEEKRKIVARIYFEVLQRTGEEYGPFNWFAQGTIQSDVIESAKSSKVSDRIKTHHNMAEQPTWFIDVPKLEPFRLLFKGDVRSVARRLRLPRDLSEKHPFPGPGGAVRIIGEVTPEKVEQWRESSAIVEDVLKKAGWHRRVSQEFAIVGDDVLPSQGTEPGIIGEVTEGKLRIQKSANTIVEEELKKAGWHRRVSQSIAMVGDDRVVGVKGDERALGYIVTVKSTATHRDRGGKLTTEWAPLPRDVLEAISKRIRTEIKEVVAVSYCITDVEATGKIIIVKATVSRKDKQEDMMTTDWPWPPRAVLREISRRIQTEVKDVGMVTYNITPKPPATIEPQ